MGKTISWKAMILLAVSGLPGFGATFTFNFNSLTGYANNSGNQAGSDSTAGSIAYELNQQLQTVCPSCSVTLLSGTNGGVTAGAIIDKTYNGDNHVVGPTQGSSVVSETLGDTPGPTAGAMNPNLSGDLLANNSSYSYSALTSQGYTNQFLATTNDSGAALSGSTDEIVLQFSGMTVSGATFNYEIFPDAADTGSLTFEAGKNTNGQDTQVFNTNGMTPGSGDGSSTHSPNSGTGSAESYVQYIGNWSGSFSSSTELDFVDWPATIGIDDLSITYTPNASTPEPTSVLLLGTLALGVFLIARRKALRA
jgi:hypothetical protein